MGENKKGFVGKRTFRKILKAHAYALSAVPRRPPPRELIARMYSSAYTPSGRCDISPRSY